MSMKSLEKLRDMLCEEIEKVSKKDSMSAGDLELVHKLTDTVKNIDKICIMDEDGGYSQAGDWEAMAHGRFVDRDGYDSGNSYANRGQHYVRGHYSRADRRGRTDARRDSRGRYSRSEGYSYDHEGMDELIDDLRDMMDGLPEEKRREVKRFVDKMERI